MHQNLIRCIVIFAFISLTASKTPSCWRNNDFDRHPSSYPVSNEEILPPPYVPFNISIVTSSNFTTNAFFQNESFKLIPRNVWIAFKTRPESLDDIGNSLNDFMNRSRHDGWNVYLLGHEEQMKFMDIYFANTSINWFLQRITRNAGASIADIFRIAVVYVFGGLYIDDDGELGTSLETIVHPNDSMIITRERNRHSNDCYRTYFNLSREGLLRKHGAIDFGRQFGGRSIVNWVFFAKPRHIILKSILDNIAHILRDEYFHRLPVSVRNSEPRWKYCVCMTGPPVWTATFIDMAISGQNLDLRISHSYDFGEYGGYMTKKDTKTHNHLNAREKSHYGITMAKQTHFLTEYAPLCPDLFENDVIECEYKLYLVENGTLRFIPNADTVASLNRSSRSFFQFYNSSELKMFTVGPAYPAFIEKTN